MEVHAFGSKHLRGYQTSGLPAWKLFSLDKIHTLLPIPIPSEAPRAGYALNDRAIPDLIAQVPLDVTKTH